MKLLVNIDKIIELIQPDIFLSENDRLIINKYIENNIMLEEDPVARKRIEKVAFLANNLDCEDVVLEIKDNKLNILSGKEMLLAHIYKSSPEVNVLIDSDKETILKVIGQENIHSLTEFNNIKKEKFLINWETVIKKANLERSVFLSKINSPKTSLYDIKQNNDYELFKEAIIKDKRFIYSLQEKHLKAFQEDYFKEEVATEDSNNTMKFKSAFLEVYKYGRMMSLFEEIQSSKVFNRFYSIENFLFHQLNAKQSNSLIRSIVEGFCSESFKGLLKDCVDNEDFLNNSLALYKEVKEKINQKDFILDKNISYKSIKLLSNEISNNLKYDKDVLKKILKSGGDYEYIYIKLLPEHLKDFNDILDFWKINKKFCVGDKEFIKSLNKKSAFLKFIDNVDLSTVQAEDLSHYNNLFNSFTKRVKEDTDIINKLIEKKLNIDFMSSFPVEKITSQMVDTLFENNMFSVLPKEILFQVKQTDRAIKIIESMTSFDIYNIPTHWLTQDILFSLKNTSFENLKLNSIREFSFEKFTNNDIEVYKKILDKSAKYYFYFPEDVMKKEELFLYLIDLPDSSKSINKHLCPIEFKSSTKIMKELIKKDYEWASEVNPILWKDPEFVMFYIDLIDREASYNQQKILNKVPIEIKNLFDSFKVTENYSNFLMKYILEGSTEDKKFTKRMKI